MGFSFEKFAFSIISNYIEDLRKSFLPHKLYSFFMFLNFQFPVVLTHCLTTNLCIR